MFYFLVLVLIAIVIYFLVSKGSSDSSKHSSSEYVSKLNIGRTETDGANCPYCEGQLKKFPKAKTKCPSCSKPIYSRKRPSDGQKVLLTEDETKILEEEWTKVYGTHGDYVKEKQEIETARSELKEQFGNEPSEGDVIWRKLNKDIVKFSGERDWHGYGQTRREMALHLNKEKKHKQAMLIAFEVCHIDCNILYNGWDQKQNETMLGLSNGKPESSSVAGGIVAIIRDAMMSLNIDNKEVKELYFDCMNQFNNSYNLPNELEETWKQIENGI